MQHSRTSCSTMEQAEPKTHECYLLVSSQVDDSSSIYSTLRSDQHMESCSTILENTSDCDSFSRKKPSTASTGKEASRMSRSSQQIDHTPEPHMLNILSDIFNSPVTSSCNRSPVSTTASSIYKGLRRPSFVSAPPCTRGSHLNVQTNVFHTLSHRFGELDSLENAYQSIVCMRQCGFASRDTSLPSAGASKSTRIQVSDVSERDGDHNRIHQLKLFRDRLQQGTSMTDQESGLRFANTVRKSLCFEEFVAKHQTDLTTQWRRSDVMPESGRNTLHCSAAFPLCQSAGINDSQSGFGDLIFELECRILAAQTKCIIDILNST